MKAICFKEENVVELKDVPEPQHAKEEHLIIKMKASAINNGDFLTIKGVFRGNSQYEICGVSGAGKVIEIGEGVPQEYAGKNVFVYRGLQVTADTLGTWSEYTQLHYLCCVILPDNVNLEEYAGSLVNMITPYAFIKQVQKDGHKGIITTAGTSATGRAMLGLCNAFNIPHISIVRNEEGKKQLEELNAKHVLMTNDPSFVKELQKLSEGLGTTAVFDGIGGNYLSKIILGVPQNSTVYCYGFLDTSSPLSINTALLTRGLTLKGFVNLFSETVRNLENLSVAIQDLTSLMHLPHFKTKVGKAFSLNEYEQAFAYKSIKGEKPIFRHTS